MFGKEDIKRLEERIDFAERQLCERDSKVDWESSNYQYGETFAGSMSSKLRSIRSDIDTINHILEQVMDHAGLEITHKSVPGAYSKITLVKSNK